MDNNIGSFNLAREIGTKVGGGKFALVVSTSTTMELIPTKIPLG